MLNYVTLTSQFSIILDFQPYPSQTVLIIYLHCPFEQAVSELKEIRLTQYQQRALIHYAANLQFFEPYQRLTGHAVIHPVTLIIVVFH